MSLLVHARSAVSWNTPIRLLAGIARSRMVRLVVRSSDGGNGAGGAVPPGMAEGPAEVAGKGGEVAVGPSGLGRMERRPPCTKMPSLASAYKRDMDRGCSDLRSAGMSRMSLLISRSWR